MSKTSKSPRLHLWEKTPTKDSSSIHPDEVSVRHWVTQMAPLELGLAKNFPSLSPRWTCSLVFHVVLASASHVGQTCFTRPKMISSTDLWFWPVSPYNPWLGIMSKPPKTSSPLAPVNAIILREKNYNINVLLQRWVQSWDHLLRFNGIVLKCFNRNKLSRTPNF